MKILSLLSKINPFPGPIWVMFLLIYVFGYMTGFALGSFSVKQDHLKTLEYLKNVK